MAADVFRKAYRELTDAEKQTLEDIKTKAKDLYDLFGVAESKGTAGREVAIAKTKLEESVMWAVKAVTA